MVVLRFLYQWIIVMPIMVVITIMTALITIIGCFLGNHRVWGYYPGLIWSRLFVLSLWCVSKSEGGRSSTVPPPMSL